MNVRQLFTTVVLSSLLTTVLLGGFFAWSGFASAQPGISESGEGRVDAAPIMTTGDETGSTLTPGTAENMTGEGGDGWMSPTTSTSLAPSLANDVNMSHWFIMGSHLLPRNSATQYVYTTNGCIYITNSGGDSRLQFPVTLPDRAIIKSVDVFYNDTSANNLTVWLTRYMPGESNQDIVFVESSGDTGWGSNSSPEITHIVDNGSWAYSLNYWWGGVTNNTLQICGVRINYIDPFYATFLPLTATE